MNYFLRIVSGALVFQLGLSPLLAQPVITQPAPIQPQMGNGFTNLRVGNLSKDGTEAILTMDYSYDGFGGQRARAFPIIQTKDQKEVSGWFGADPVTIGPGRGIISIRVKYFNDEPGVPPQLTTDRLRILMVSQSGTVVISSIPFLKTIKWGRPKEASPPVSAQASNTESDKQARRKAETKELADARAKAEAEAREQARIQTETEAKRLAEEKRIAEQKAQAEAAERARQGAAETKSMPRDLVPTQQRADRSTTHPQKTEAHDATVDISSIASDLKTKITNVDVVNRSLDRTQMTIGVEFEYKDNIGPKPMLGINIVNSSVPAAASYFQSKPAEIGRSRRNFLLFPVKYQPPETSAEYASITTDKVVVFLQEAASAKRYNLFPATMLLKWRLPGVPMQAAAPTSDNTVELEDLKQNEPHAGYLTLRYHLVEGSGRLRTRIFDSKNPASAKWFDSTVADVKAGHGVQVLEVMVSNQAQTPDNILKADTIEIELVDLQGQVLSRVQKQIPMTWAKPPE